MSEPVMDEATRQALQEYQDRRPARELAHHIAEGGYTSTGCLHGDHAYCQAMTGAAGAKRPGECKFCGLKCSCDCHMADEDAT